MKQQAEEEGINWEKHDLIVVTMSEADRSVNQIKIINHQKTMCIYMSICLLLHNARESLLICKASFVDCVVSYWCWSKFLKVFSLSIRCCFFATRFLVIGSRCTRLSTKFNNEIASKIGDVWIWIYELSEFSEAQPSIILKNVYTASIIICVFVRCE